jgi:hypothetical protein
MTLADIIRTQGAQAIEQHGTLIFTPWAIPGEKGHAAGVVAEAMATDFDVDHPEKSPAFFFHLGDVIYGFHKDQTYRTEFYEPYEHYTGKIIAIAGNHDGEVFSDTDPKSLQAFRANFCATDAKVPPVAGSIFRQTMTQPGVYWFLDAPFVDIIGLYSNAAENPGFISGSIPGAHQKTMARYETHGNREGALQGQAEGT